jgi:hypothetical protein
MTVSSQCKQRSEMGKVRAIIHRHRVPVDSMSTQFSYFSVHKKFVLYHVFSCNVSSTFFDPRDFCRVIPELLFRILFLAFAVNVYKLKAFYRRHVARIIVMIPFTSFLESLQKRISINFPHKYRLVSTGTLLKFKKLFNFLKV